MIQWGPPGPSVRSWRPMRLRMAARVRSTRGAGSASWGPTTYGAY